MSAYSFMFLLQECCVSLFIIFLCISDFPLKAAYGYAREALTMQMPSAGAHQQLDGGSAAARHAAPAADKYDSKVTAATAGPSHVAPRDKRGREPRLTRDRKPAMTEPAPMRGRERCLVRPESRR